MQQVESRGGVQLTRELADEPRQQAHPATEPWRVDVHRIPQLMNQDAVDLVSSDGARSPEREHADLMDPCQLARDCDQGRDHILAASWTKATRRDERESHRALRSGLLTRFMTRCRSNNFHSTLEQRPSLCSVRESGWRYDVLHVQRGRFDRAICPFVLVLALAAVAHWAFPFDGLYGQDAIAYFDFARAISPHFANGVALPDLYWPRGYPAAIAALLPITRGSPLAGQLVSTLACAWAAAATFLLVREFDRARNDARPSIAAIVAGVTVGGSGVALRCSQVVMADGLAIGFAATALWCAAHFLRARRPSSLIACALSVACGAVTRWQIGLLIFPILAALLSNREVVQSTPRRYWAAAGLLALAVLGPQLVIAAEIPSALAHHEWLERWNLLNAFRRDFQTSEGHAHYRFPVGVFYLARLGWPDAFFPTIAGLAVFGAWTIVRERRAAEMVLLVGWPLVNWAFVSGIPYENPRFIWPALPAVGALAGIGFQTLRRRLPDRRAGILAGLLAASIIGGVALGAREHSRTVARKNADRATVDWIDATVPAGATLLMPEGTSMLEHYGRTRVHDLYELTSDQVDELLAHECPCFYFGDPTEIDTIHSGLPMQAYFHALMRNPGLTPLATHGSWILFRVGRVR